MSIKDNKNKYNSFRDKYPFFEYKNYSFTRNDGSIKATYCFNLSDRYIFNPSIEIPARDFYNVNSLTDSELNNYIFHIGMIELISYWKAACPKKVIITPHKLENEQVDWWKKLYFHGLGEFFYLNGINETIDSFMTIESYGTKLDLSTINLKSDKAIVPIGGGKDSVVTLELLAKSDITIVPMIINPRAASIRTIETANYKIQQSIVVNRKLDNKLLELNKLGFLNGHTPFSAMLAFTTALCSAISGIGNIALSNESSANESTLPGSKINHQYSKTYEFEYDFNWYIKKFVHANMNYFSFLRPLNELQIAMLFAKFPSHFKGFRSCNVGSKTDEWCGNCSKCLFTYIILSPFIERNKLIEIFNKDMLNDNKLLPIFKELTGIAAVKPFECVGTPNEVVSSMCNYINNNDKPLLLSNLNLKYNNNFDELISDYNNENLLPKQFEIVLKNSLYD